MAVARSIHNVYLRPFTFHNDGVVNVPFRISKNRYQDFLTIHDERLGLYSTDFTSYIRTMLVEYSSKTLSQREYLYAYPLISALRKVITKNVLCKVYHANTYDIFVPISIETSPIYDYNNIVGVTSDLKPIAVRLNETTSIKALDGKINITTAICDMLYE